MLAEVLWWTELSSRQPVFDTKEPLSFLPRHPGIQRVTGNMLAEVLWWTELSSNSGFNGEGDQSYTD
eukprot:1083435-Pelagomonas_calceolata.AAC.2